MDLVYSVRTVLRLAEHVVLPCALGIAHAFRVGKLPYLTVLPSEGRDGPVIVELVLLIVTVDCVDHDGSCDPDAGEEAYADTDNCEHGKKTSESIADLADRHCSQHVFFSARVLHKLIPGYHRRKPIALRRWAVDRSIPYHSISEMSTRFELRYMFSIFPLLTVMTRSAIAVRAEL